MSDREHDHEHDWADDHMHYWLPDEALFSEPTHVTWSAPSSSVREKHKHFGQSDWPFYENDIL